jgi:3-deoxy-D-manno-octulosonate 8-phosphate phosphatase (KDO 8-P phosphatase)
MTARSAVVRARRPVARAAKRAPIRGPVRILFLDLDGTLTDGLIIYYASGDARDFFIRDGLALQWARGLGLLPVVISGRPSRAAELRLEDLEVEHYLDIKDKVAVAERVLAREGVAWDRCAMVGDDLPDVPLMRRVGWSFAVADAIPTVRELAHTVTHEPGGRGAVRAVVERLLKHNGTWERVLERYEAG